MRILIIRNYPSHMSVRNNTYNIQEVGLAKALVRKGNICDILFWTDKEEENVELTVDGYGKINVFYRHSITFLKNTIYSNCNDLFNCYDVLQPCEYNQLQALILAKKYPEKTIIYHGPYYSAFNKRYNLMCKFFDMFFLNQYVKNKTQFLTKSELAREFLISKGINQNNVRTVGVGIDAQMLLNDKGECSERLYLKMKEDKTDLKLLYIGRLEKRRNVLFILDVLAGILKKGYNAKFYIVGTGEKKYVQSVFEYADKLNISDRIVWQDRMEQKYLAAIYKMADFFLLPTEYEIFGMVLLEAMYHKTVVLTTQNGGSSTLVLNKNNGLIIDKLESEIWVNAIKDIFDNKERMLEMQKAASETVKKNFTWDVLSEKFIAAYSELFEKR